MRVSRVITVIGLFAVCLVAFFFVGPRLTHYCRFQHRGDEYFAQLAKACDAIIAGHPLGTNQFIELSAADPSLPKMVRDLQPLKVKVQAQRIWILHGGVIPFGITWEQDE